MTPSAFCRVALIVVLASSLDACAGRPTPSQPPSAATMAQVPVVRYGDAAPAGKDFVLYFPAGTPLTVIARINGTLLAQDATANLSVRLKRDVYLYHDWISYNGQVWLQGWEGVSQKFDIGLPGVVDGRNPGNLSATFDLR